MRVKKAPVLPSEETFGRRDDFSDCGRPRPQQAQIGLGLRMVTMPGDDLTLLRPRTGALRSAAASPRCALSRQTIVPNSPSGAGVESLEGGFSTTATLCETLARSAAFTPLHD